MKTFTKKTVIVFTTIEIQNKVILFSPSERFSARFKFGNTELSLKNHTITNGTLNGLIEQIKQFLGCEIDERHYIIK